MIDNIPHFNIDRADTYMYFASNMLPNNPVIVEVGSIHGAHGIKLCSKFDHKLTMIAYEAGKENYESLVNSVMAAYNCPSGVTKHTPLVPIICRRAAVTGSDGTTEFFEFEEISSNSVYPRHEGEGRHLRRASKVRSVSLETIIEENRSNWTSSWPSSPAMVQMRRSKEAIDLLFLNCEGAELGILGEVLTKPELRDKLGQLCVSFHGGRIYPQVDTEEIVRRMSEFFWVVEEKNDWPCHLFVNKGLKQNGG